MADAAARRAGRRTALPRRRAPPVADAAAQRSASRPPGAHAGAPGAARDTGPAGQTPDPQRHAPQRTPGEHAPASASSPGGVAAGDDAPGHAFLFRAGGACREISFGAAIEWLQRGDDKREFLWLHFHDTARVLQDWPMRLLQLPHLFTDTLDGGSRSTRVAYDNHGLIAVINDVDYDFARTEPLAVATLWLYAGGRFLLSVRSLALRSVARLRNELRSGTTYESPLALLIHLLREQRDTLADIARDAAQRSNQVETTLRANRLPARAQLGSIRRDLVRLRRLLAPEPAALFRLVSRPPRWMRDEDAQALRQAAEAFALTVRDIDGLQQHIALLEEEIAARVGEHTNRNVLILTAATVIALPVNLISGLFGMNIGGMPLRYDAHGFALALLLSMTLTALCTALVLRLWRA